MALRKKKTLLDQAQAYVEAVRPHVESAVVTTREAVEDFVENTAWPALSDARDKAVPAVKEAADTGVAALRGEEPAKKGGKLKKFALFAVLAGAVGLVAKKLQGGKQAETWQSSYVPKPAPAAAPVPASVQDTGGSAPDEAISDAAEDPHPVTTPDEPAEVVDIETSERRAPTKATKQS